MIRMGKDDASMMNHKEKENKTRREREEGVWWAREKTKVEEWKRKRIEKRRKEKTREPQS